MSQNNEPHLFCVLSENQNLPIVNVILDLSLNGRQRNEVKGKRVHTGIFLSQNQELVSKLKWCKC